MAEHNEIGVIGENVACRFLINKGFKVLERNYRRKWGELDVIAQNKGITHFVEVKTVSCEIIEDIDTVNHETADSHRPEDNIHPDKIKRLKRIIQTYSAHKLSAENEWQFDVVTVLLDVDNKVAKVQLIEDIIL